MASNRRNELQHAGATIERGCIDNTRRGGCASGEAPPDRCLAAPVPDVWTKSVEAGGGRPERQTIPVLRGSRRPAVSGTTLRRPCCYSVVHTAAAHDHLSQLALGLRRLQHGHDVYATAGRHSSHECLALHPGPAGGSPGGFPKMSMAHAAISVRSARIRSNGVESVSLGSSLQTVRTALKDTRWKISDLFSQIGPNDTTAECAAMEVNIVFVALG